VDCRGYAQVIIPAHNDCSRSCDRDPDSRVLAFQLAMFRPRRLLFFTMLALVALSGGAGSIDVFAEEEAESAVNGELVEGQSLTLRADVEGGIGPFRFQWFKNFVPIAAAGRELRFDSIQLSDAGTYWVTAFNDSGSVTSEPDTLVVRAGEPSRLANVSIAASLGERVIVGFALGGDGTSGSTAVLTRAAGPALQQFGVAGTLPDPVLSLFQQARLVERNDNWGGDASLASAAAAVGGFPFAETSKDAAVLLSLERANYSAEVIDAAQGTGLTVVEVYDLTPRGSRSTPRLINVSARATTGASQSILTAGFTIQGERNVTVLIRGIGPSLTRLGVADALGNPRLNLFRGADLISSNENWGDVAPEAIEDARAAVGAFPLEPESLDAAILMPLKPGSYSVQVNSGGGAGVALIEVYEVR
jgi:hypothetical protein